MAIPVIRSTDLPVVSVEQMAEVDRIMIDELGISLLQMMENAGRNIAELARSLLGGSLADRQVAVLAGPGHNGGGGLVALDLPSGLDPDTGSVMNPHITARATLTLAAPKAGLLVPEAQSVAGDLYVGDISVPGSVYARLGLAPAEAIFDGGPIVRVVKEELSSSWTRG